MRTSLNITTGEDQAWQSFCQKYGIIPDGKNAEFVANYFLTTWPNDITEENLNLALPQLKPHLKFYTPVQLEAKSLLSSMSEDALAIIGNWFRSNRLIFDPDAGFSSVETLENINAIVGWLVKNRRAISWQGLNLALQNVIQSPAGKSLHWKKMLQDSEKEELRRRQEPSPFAKSEKKDEKEWWNKQSEQSDEFGNPGGGLLPPHLKHHREMMHRPAETVAPDPAAVRAASQREYEQKSKALVAHTVDGAVSHMDQRQMDRLFVMAGSEIDWAATYHSRLLFLQRRTNERASAGRRG